VTAERHREHYNGPVRSACAVLILAKVVDDCAWAAATLASTMATRSEAGALSYGGRSGRLGDADKKGDGRNLDPEVGDGAADVDKLRQGRRRQWRRSRQGGSSDADLNFDGALLRVRGVRRPVSSVRPAGPFDAMANRADTTRDTAGQVRTFDIALGRQRCCEVATGESGEGVDSEREEGG
jgi:hypothetical protein